MNIIEHNIIQALQNFEIRPLREAAIKFLNTLGYHSTRTSNETRDRQLRQTLESEVEASGILSDQRAISDWQAFHILFQITDDEANFQKTIVESPEMDLDLMDSYVFAALELSGDTYSRTQLANITRFINKGIKQPIMVIFRYGDVLSLGIINRRWNQRDPSKQVLEQVTLIKDIRLNNPHAAHRRILADLWLEKLSETQSVRNFDTLHTAWTGVLDTEPLTREFYSKLHKWYQWAVAECRFPDKENELQVIRLITRLLFIWFLKEKHFEGQHLVPPDLFDEHRAKEHLNHYDPEASDYYRAVLQNLFFATLNTPINERRFGKDGSTYHFSNLLKNPVAFLEHLKQVPFVNGGLFDYHVTQECFTDDTNEQQNLHIPAKLFFDATDGIFSLFTHYKFTVEERTPIEQEIALDPELLGQVFENLLGVYNPETRKAASRRKATGSYYTPRKVVEYMVDESLIAYFLQKVEPYDNDREYLEERLRLNLEDLLAYESRGNEGETSDHLIHDSEIESLIQAINELKILDPAVGSGAFPMDILNKLVLILQKLDPQNERWKQSQLQQASRILDPESKRKSIQAIEEVFSEANFHNDYGRKLYLIQNCIYGVDIQPFAITIAKLRFFISLVIEQKPNKASDNNYGIRTLPNLETKLVAANTLVGLKKLQESDTLLLLEDNMVQLLLHQMLELRVNYFDVQTPDNKQEHIKAEGELRNLLDKTLDLQYEAWCVQEQNNIKQQVSQLPTETARQHCKAELQQKYRIREAKFKEGVAEAKRIAQWNAYDPNAAADFFEPEYMFGIKGGFDIAIGNPPYIRHEKIQHLKPVLRIQFEDFFTSKADISVYFYKRVAEFLRHGGILTYICTNKFLRSDYGGDLRQFLITNMSLEILLDLGNVPVFKAAVDTCITLMKKYFPAANHSLGALTLRRVSNDFNIHDMFQKQAFPIELTNLSSDVWAIAPPDAQALLKKLQHTGNTLKECVNLHMGLKTGRNEAFVIDADTRDSLIDEDVGSDELIKPVLKGGTVCKWKTKPPDEYLIVIESSANRSWPWSNENDELEAEQIFAEHYPAVFDHLNADRKKLRGRGDKGKYYWELRSCAYYTEFDKQKIIYPDISKSMRACYDTTQVLSLQTAYILPTDDLSLLAILNSRIVDWYARYRFQCLNDPWAGGSPRFIFQYMTRVPIPDRTATQKAELSRLVEQILADPESKDVPEFEKEIDELLYQLYGLSQTEIALIRQTYRDAGML